MWATPPHLSSCPLAATCFCTPLVFLPWLAWFSLSLFIPSATPSCFLKNLPEAPSPTSYSASFLPLVTFAIPPPLHPHSLKILPLLNQPFLHSCSVLPTIPLPFLLFTCSCWKIHIKYFPQAYQVSMSTHPGSPCLNLPLQLQSLTETSVSHPIPPLTLTLGLPSPSPSLFTCF